MQHQQCIQHPAARPASPTFYRKAHCSQGSMLGSCSIRGTGQIHSTWGFHAAACVLRLSKQSRETNKFLWPCSLCSLCSPCPPRAVPTGSAEPSPLLTAARSFSEHHEQQTHELIRPLIKQVATHTFNA